jgi:hypothetical protein
MFIKMEQIQDYIKQCIYQGYTEFQATTLFLQDENVKFKYKKIYLESLPNYTPPVPMDIDEELAPPKYNPVLRRF